MYSFKRFSTSSVVLYNHVTMLHNYLKDRGIYDLKCILSIALES